MVAKKQSAFLAYVLGDVLGQIPGVTARSMFGGYALYQHGIVFAIIVEDVLYFKADATLSKRFSALGSQPFVYEAKGGKRVSMSYWQLPEEIQEDPIVIQEWVANSVQLSVTKPAKKRRKQKK